MYDLTMLDTLLLRPSMELYVQYRGNVKAVGSQNIFDFPFDRSMLLQSPCAHVECSSLGPTAAHTVFLLKHIHVSVIRKRLCYISDDN